jgi:PAS domain S-box-containing protein
MLGYTKAELTQKFSELTYPEDISKNIHLFEEMVAGRRDHYWLEKRYYHKDGSIVWANLMVTAIRGRNKEFKYNFAIVENITERKKLEDQLRHAQKMEAVGQLAGGVAHDFNNILTAIIGYASLLKLKLKGNEQVMHNVNQIISITERGAGLTQSLLAFSRKQDISLKPIKLNDLMERVIKLIPRIIGEEIEFRKILSDEKMMVMADSSQLEQVLMNLAGNARDAMQDDGVLTIETEYVMLDLNHVKMQGFGSPGPYALISVSDTGIGIEPETIGKIFEPFFTTKEVGEGTGLGLSLVYGIIKQHNGYVNVYSEPDHGATFKIYLPLIGEVNTEHEHIEDESIIGGTETILLAEDETEVREVIKELLHEYGFSVIDAVNGKDAVDKYSENKDNIDLLLMDVVMPKMNGKEAYDAIKKITPGIKALFTSGYTSKKIDAKGVLQEGIHYISKPVNPRILLKKIREVLDES